MLVKSGPLTAEAVMAKDSSLLQDLQDEPILHLYQMTGRAATYGYFTKLETLLNLQLCQEAKIELAKRPTGGGVIFHFLDYAFSYLVPKGHPHFSENTLDNYRTVNSLVKNSLQTLLPQSQFSFISPDNKNLSTFCMAHPTPYDLLCDGKKIVGAAQRKTQKGFLHQGSISILTPTAEVLNTLLEPKMAEEILHNSFFFTENPSELASIRSTIEASLISHFDLK